MEGGGVRSLNIPTILPHQQQQFMDGATPLTHTTPKVISNNNKSDTSIIPTTTNDNGGSSNNTIMNINGNKIVTLSRQQLAQQRSNGTSMNKFSTQHNTSNSDTNANEGSRTNKGSSSTSTTTTTIPSSLPPELVSSLLEFGNWRARSDAMMSLQQLVHSLDRISLITNTNTNAGLLPSLMRLLLVLIKDNNFKMAKTAISVLGDVTDKSGIAIVPYVNDIMRALLEVKTTHAASSSSTTTGSIPITSNNNINNTSHNTGSSHVIDDMGGVKLEHTKLIRKLIKSCRSTLIVLDPLLNVLDNTTTATTTTTTNNNSNSNSNSTTTSDTSSPSSSSSSLRGITTVREDVLDIAIACLLEFPLNGSESDTTTTSTTSTSNESIETLSKVIGHLIHAIEQQHTHNDAATTTSTATSDKVSSSSLTTSITSKLYDCCIEAIALLYCQVGKKKLLSVIDTMYSSMHSKAYKTIMRRLEEEEVHIKYKQIQQLQQQSNNSTSGSAAPNSSVPTTASSENTTTGNGGTITIHSKRYIKDIPWEVPPPSRQSRSRQGSRLHTTTNNDNDNVSSGMEWRGLGRAASANHNTTNTNTVVGVTATGRNHNVSTSSSSSSMHTNDNNVKEDDVLKMTENEKVNLWLPSSHSNDDDVVMGMDIENDITSNFSGSPNYPHALINNTTSTTTTTTTTNHQNNGLMSKMNYHNGVSSSSSMSSSSAHHNHYGVDNNIANGSTAQKYSSFLSANSGTNSNNTNRKTSSSSVHQYGQYMNSSNNNYHRSNSSVSPTSPPDTTTTTNTPLRSNNNTNTSEYMMHAHEPYQPLQELSMSMLQQHQQHDTHTSIKSTTAAAATPKSFNEHSTDNNNNNNNTYAHTYRSISRTQRLHNMFNNNMSNNTNSNSILDGVQRPETVSSVSSSSNSNGNTNGTTTTTNDGSVAGKLSILKRRAISRRAISAGNTPRESDTNNNNDNPGPSNNSTGGTAGAHTGGGIFSRNSHPLNNNSNGTGLSIDVPSPPTAPPKSTIFHRTRTPNTTTTTTTHDSISNTQGAAAPSYGGYSPSLHHHNNSTAATTNNTTTTSNRISTPKSTPAVFADSNSYSATNNISTPSLSSGGSGSGIMTPNTRSRLRSVHEQGSQPFEEIPTEALLPIVDDDIETVFRTACQTLASAAAATHKELDWGAQYEALIEMRRLTVHHPAIIAPSISARYNSSSSSSSSSSHHLQYHVLKCILNAVTSLRSHVSKTALILLNEMFVFMGKVMEHELESIVPVLVKRSSLQDFLATIAKKALTEMSTRCDEFKVVGSLLAFYWNGTKGNSSSGSGSSSSMNSSGLSATVRTAACVTMSIATEKLIIRINNSAGRGRGYSNGNGNTSDNGHGGSFSGSSSSLSSLPITEKLFQFGVGALDESHPEGRSSGRKVLYLLFTAMDSHAFDLTLRRYTNENNAKKVKQAIEQVMKNSHNHSVSSSGANKKGRSRNRSSSSNGSSTSDNGSMRDRSFSTDSETDSMMSQSSSTSSTALVNNGSSNTTTNNNMKNNNHSFSHLNDAMTNHSPSDDSSSVMITALTATKNDDELIAMCFSLSRTDTMEWRKKVDALGELPEISQALVNRGLLTEQRLAAIFDHVVHRLADGNSKVVAIALSTVANLFPIFGDGSCIALNSLMPLLSNTLSATNDRTRNLTIHAIDMLISSSDASLLLQNLTHCVSHGPVRGKHILVDKLTSILGSVYSSKPQAVIRYALPACFSLMRHGSSHTQDMRHASMNLCKELARCVGKDVMMNSAASLSETIQTKLEDILATC